MATTLVLTERQDQIRLDEQMHLLPFEDERALLQIERLGWALGSAIREAQQLHDADHAR